ncbi:hypothetical protein, partial [Vibrio zhanjiangensis]|uniref:hypothetical protein n=1 Tax=Vibrio zhanjiangensis TaxID=1046128 RepID=UPI0024E0E365
NVRIRQSRMVFIPSRSLSNDKIGCGNAKSVRAHSDEKCNVSRVHFDNIPKLGYTLRIGQ